MNNDSDKEPHVPDFSSLTETAHEIQQIVRPIVLTIQRFQEHLQPIISAVKKLQSDISPILGAFTEAACFLDAINKLGDAQFVCWNHIGKDFIDALVNTNNIDKTLREYLAKEKYKSVYNTIANCESDPYMKKHLRLFKQCVWAFNNGHNDLAVNGLTSILDGLLSDISGNLTHKLLPRTNTIIEKLEKDEILDNEEYSTLILAFTFQDAMESFSMSIPFNEKEPKKLNRHWIAHGRSRRQKTKLDCVKLINLIYGVLLINELDKSK